MYCSFQRRSNRKVLCLFNEKLNSEDLDMRLRIAKQYQIGCLEKPLVYYRLHENNVHNNYKQMRLTELQIIDGWKNERLYRRAISNCYIRWFNKLSDREKIIATKYLLLALKKDVTSFFINMNKIFIIQGLIKLCLPKCLVALRRKLRRIN